MKFTSALMMKHTAAWIGIVSIALLVSGCPKPEAILYQLGTINRSNGVACLGLMFADPELELSLDGRYVFCTMRIVLSESAKKYEDWRVTGFSITGQDGAPRSFDHAFARHTFKDYVNEESLRLTAESDKSIGLQRGENVIRLSARFTEKFYSSEWILRIRLICAQTNDMTLTFQVPEQTKRKLHRKFAKGAPISVSGANNRE